MRNISVDLNRVQGTMNRAATFGVSASRAYTLMLHRHREHLRMAVKECGFKYLRFHGLLQDDMGVYREDAQGNAIWGWQYVDAVYDFLVEIGIRPVVVLDFMPQALASGPDTVYWERANITPPKDYEKWAVVVRAVARHFVERYGEQEVSQWFFEVWNEPDLRFFFTGGVEEYEKLYEASARAIKSVSKYLRVGGPAISHNVPWIDRLISYCEQHQVPIDFVSAHCYCRKPFEEGKEMPPEPGYPVWREGYPWTLGNVIYDPEGGTRLLRSYNEAIARSARPELDLYVTEWGLTCDYWDPLRDSYEAASLLLSCLSDNLHCAKSFSLCEVSDIFEEDGPPTQDHFHGGFGLINLQGIRKPAYFAYKYLHELSDVRLCCEDARAIACADGRAAQVLFWDDSVRQDCDNKHYYCSPHFARPLDPARVIIAGLKSGAYRYELHAVGYRKNDAYTAFHDLPRRDSLSREQVGWLDAIASDRPMEQRVVTVGADGVFSVEVNMNENDVCFVKLFQL